MPTNDLSQITTTNMQGTVPETTISSQSPDQENVSGETVWDYPDAEENLGIYNEVPELKSAIKVLAKRVAGVGIEGDSEAQGIIQNIKGWGEDSFMSIMIQMVIEKKVFGDAFAEIVKSESGVITNLKKLYPGNMRVVVNDQGIIIRYEQRNKGNNKRLKPEQILHLVNDRMTNEIHGTSVIKTLKFIIEAKNEAIRDERVIRHRELLGILQVDTNDPAKIATAITTYQKAIKNKEHSNKKKQEDHLEFRSEIELS